MKTNLLKVSPLVLLLLLGACGKAPKENTENDIKQNNSAMPAIKTFSSDELSHLIVTDNLKGLEQLVTETMADLNEAINGEDTPLIKAIRMNALLVADYLLKIPVSIQKTNSRSGQSPLMVAAEKNRLTIVQRLIDMKASIDHKDFKGETALHLALRNKHENLALLLIKSGANPDITDSENNNAFNLAKKHGLKQVETLLANMIKVEVGSPTAIDFKDVISSLDIATLRQMLSKHPRVAQDYEYMNPLSMLIQKGGNAAQQMADLLLRTKPYPVNVNGPKNELAPLIQAAIYQKRSFMNLLLNHGANPQVYDGEGQSPLIHMVGYNDLEMVENLLSAKAKVKYKTKVDGDKKTFDACDVARTKAKTYKKGSEERKINDEIKKKLECDFWDWLF